MLARPRRFTTQLAQRQPGLWLAVRETGFRLRHAFRPTRLRGVFVRLKGWKDHEGKAKLAKLGPVEDRRQQRLTLRPIPLAKLTLAKTVKQDCARSTRRARVFYRWPRAKARVLLKTRQKEWLRTVKSKLGPV